MTTVLIVDDKEDNRYLLEKLLQGNGYETVIACNGAEALDAALKNPPDIIISDILMPVMDGFTLCREWKKNARLKKIPFVFYTATYTDQKDEDFARALGADCFVVKPKEPEEFLKIVKNILAALRKGTLHSASILEPEEKVFLREYNEALVRKLENKMLEAEQAEQRIKQYAAELEIRIEELKRAEAEVKESEVNLKSLIENSKQAIWSIDNNYHFIIFNSFCCKEYLTTCNAELKKGMSAIDVLSPEMRLFWKEKYDTALSGQRIIFEFSEINGRAPHFFEVFLNPIVSDGNIMGISAIKINITARKHAEEKIAEQARLLDVALDAIIVRDMNDRLLYWNRAAEQLYGWTFEEAKEMSLTKLVADLDLARLEQAKRVLLESGTWEGELHQKTGTGGFRVIQSRWTMVRDKEGKPSARLIINRDVTDQHALEAQFRRTQRLESLGALAGGIAHDLNNVLAPILLATDILNSGTRDPQMKKMIDSLQSSAERGRDIVKQVLAFARGSEQEFSPQQLRYIVKEIEAIIKETFPKTITLRTDIPKDIHPVWGDMTQLHQVLMNLCVNARDAMPRGGTLTISVSNITIDETYAKMQHGAQPGEYVILRISDTGTGIPKDIQEKIFEPFFTTKDVGKGTGLGLSTVFTIVKDHKGFINLYSEVGKGTEFSIYFPAILSEEIMVGSREKAIPPSGNGEAILVVDDELIILQITKETLETYGYRVLTAGDGAEATAIFASQARGSISLVITDINMPVMGGQGCIKALRRIDPSVKIILSSGILTEIDSVNLAMLDIQGYVTKPYNAEKLLRTIHEVLLQKNLL